MSKPTNATVVAVNHNLGIFVIDSRGAAETSASKGDTCIVLESIGRLSIDVGDTLSADWDADDYILVSNVTQNRELRAKVQTSAVSRGEAVSSMAVI